VARVASLCCREAPLCNQPVDSATDLWHTICINICIDAITEKLTISIDDRVYDGLHAIVGKGNIGRFLENLARPFVVTDSLSAAYVEMTGDRDRESTVD
jgi:hypothetical protein